MKKSEIGLIGLAVMGENLVLNMESRGFTVSVYNRTTQKVTDFLEGRARGKQIQGAYSLEELVSQLKRPRKVMLMVKAGPAVDSLIEQLIPLLEPGDIIIDGGNSHFPDTIRRTAYVEKKGLLYVGTGVSGGEEGALTGPSLMPGGSVQAWPYVRPVFQSIAAKAEDEMPCCTWIGKDGAGHFVKMVHNGIEYGDMQLICEAYQIMRDYLKMTPDEMQEVFAVWNQGELKSYLMEITAEILKRREEDGTWTIDVILDVAGQKGTGKWTALAALDEGVPLTMIGEAVFARCLSAEKEERLKASELLTGPAPEFGGDRKAFLQDLRAALYASKIVSYAQGYALLRTAARTYGWDLNYGEIALLWRGGCIIRSAFLEKIRNAFERNPDLENLLLDAYFRKVMEQSQGGWRRVCAAVLQNGLPAAVLCSALTYYDGYRTPRSAANLLQAQRDYFGAHTYERVDKARGEFFHTNWTGAEEGAVAGNYLV